MRSLAFTPLIVSYTLEILPYSLRAKGFNVFNFVISVALIFNQYVNPIALGNIGWKYYIVFCCLLVAFLFIVWFLFPETKGYSLEEIAVIFDGPNAKVTEKSDEAEKEILESKSVAVAAHAETS